jgi:hypothetical protein
MGELQGMDPAERLLLAARPRSGLLIAPLDEVDLPWDHV